MALSRTGFIFVFFHLIHAISTQEIMTQDTAVNKQEMFKRVPQGFIGMRGKKYIEPLEVEQFNKRKPQFFVGVKGKKYYNVPYLLDEYKRAPMGFVGMRGKKDIYSSDPYYPYELPQKQGSLIGEIDYTAEDNQQIDQFPLLNELLNEYLQKQDNPEKTNEIQKRAANMNQFYGVRGKKSIQNKRPYDLTFRGRFIGVRGKKDASFMKNDEIRYLLDTKESLPKRKSQVGFFGMRGKKWTDDLITETEDQ